MRAFLFLALCMLSGTVPLFSEVSLTLSTNYPQKNSIIQFSYQEPFVIGMETVATLYLSCKSKLYATSVNVNLKNCKYFGSFKIPDSAEAFALVFWNNQISKSSRLTKHIFVYQVYSKERGPVKGAYFEAAKIYANQSGHINGVKPDIRKALELAKLEFKEYPENRGKYLADYFALSLLLDKKSMRPAIYESLHDSLEYSTSEKSVVKLRDVYFSASGYEKEDSINNLIIQKFPGGETDIIKQIRTTYSEKNTDSIYAKILRIKNSHQNANFKSGILGLYLSENFQGMALESAKKMKIIKFENITHYINDKKALARLNNYLATELESNGYLNKAEKYSLASIKFIEEYKMDKPTYITTVEWENQIGPVEATYLDVEGRLLSRKGLVKRALNDYEKAVKLDSTQSNINQHLIECLIKNQRNRDAYRISEKFIRSGYTNEILNKLYMTLYVRIKGSDLGYSKHLKDLNIQAESIMEKGLVMALEEDPAKPFEVTDINGKSVTLDSLKGKTIILDFWASWCIPCISSFKCYQEIVNNYRNDSSLYFGFINTSESCKDDERVKMVKKMMLSKNLHLPVLFDELISQSRYRTSEDYQVSVLPTLIAIDKSGKIRFREVGYDGKPEILKLKIKCLIKLLSSSR